MRICTLLLSALVLSTTALKAQIVATFDTLHLSKADTFYVNYTAPGADVGFNDGNAHFPCIYDTSYGGIWTSGFAYSNMTDSVTSGYGNQYSAKTAIGYGGSSNYVVAHVSDPVTFANTIKIILTDSAIGKPVQGFYATNNTYAYNSMRDGDFFGKKFTNGDWFLLTVQGYSGGTLQPASVGIYLADFLFPDPTKNFILDTWKWVDLRPLGAVDSLQLSLTSSDNGIYGMNTPAYFSMDNFTTSESTVNTSLSVSTAAPIIAKVYPNPATNTLYADITGSNVQQVTIMNMAGSTITDDTILPAPHVAINTSSLPAGMYLLKLSGDHHTLTTRFIKE